MTDLEQVRLEIAHQVVERLLHGLHHAAGHV
jgi:hypothetical protein